MAAPVIPSFAVGITCAALTLCLACQRAEDKQPSSQGPQVSEQTIAAMEARIERDGADAAEPLVQLVVASPVALPPGELDRLGRLLLSQSDPASLLDTLRELAVERPDSDKLQDWLHALENYEASIVRGIDVDVGRPTR
jgi:hypothetical protein